MSRIYYHIFKFSSSIVSQQLDDIVLCGCHELTLMLSQTWSLSQGESANDSLRKCSGVKQ